MICFKPGIMLNTIRVCSLIAVSMTLMLTQGPRFGGLQESWNLCSHSLVKLPKATQMFVMVDYVREITVKKSCKNGEYGSFEHLLLFCAMFC